MKSILFNRKGEGHIDTGVKIIIAVVIGALILSALYFLFSGEDGILGKLNNEVEGMMDYTQSLRYKRNYDADTGLYTLLYSYDGKHWNTPTMPEYSETATVYKVMNNGSTENRIDVALIKDDTLYYILNSFDGGVTWTEQLSFSTSSDSSGVTHCYYGGSGSLPKGCGSFEGSRFVIRYHKGGSTYYTITSNGETFTHPSWSDMVLRN